MKEKKFLFKGFTHILLILFSGLMAFPFFWMLTSSIKTKSEIWQFPPTLFPEVPQWHNYVDAINAAPFFRYIFNSSFTAICIVLIVLVNSAMMAYAFTQMEFKGKNILFGIVIGTYMLPAAATYVPAYIILARFNMLDSYEGLIISNAVSVFGIFLLRQSFMQVNKEIIQAAKIDGLGHWGVLWKIVFPLTKTSFVTLGLITFITQYNNYLWPSLIIKSKEYYVITMGLQHFFTAEGAYGLKWGLIMAATSLTVIPLLFIFLIAQKWFMNGITSDSGIKG